MDQKQCDENKEIALKALNQSISNQNNIVRLIEHIEGHEILCNARHAEIKNKFGNLQWWHRWIFTSLVVVMFGIIGEFIYIFILTK